MPNNQTLTAGTQLMDVLLRVKGPRTIAELIAETGTADKVIRESANKPVGEGLVHGGTRSLSNRSSGSPTAPTYVGKRST